MKKKIILTVLILVAIFIGLFFVSVGGYKVTLFYNTGNSASICFLPILTKGQTLEVTHLNGTGVEYHYLPVHQKFADTVCKMVGIE